MIPYPAVRIRDLKILSHGLKGSGVRVEVRWVRREEENWWDRVSRALFVQTGREELAQDTESFRGELWKRATDLTPSLRFRRVQEMREGLEGEVYAAREAGEEWVKGVQLLRDGEDEEEGDTLVLPMEEKERD